MYLCSAFCKDERKNKIGDRDRGGRGRHQTRGTFCINYYYNI